MQFTRLYLGLVALSFDIGRSPGANQDHAGMVAHGPPQWPQYIAHRTRLELRRSISRLDYVTVGGGGAQQLAGGSLNIAHSGYPDFARAALQGAP